MKKPATLIIITLVILLFASTSSQAQENSGEHDFSFGMVMGPTQQDQILKPIFIDIFKFIKETEGVDIGLEWFQDSSEFLAKIEKKELDFAYAKELDVFTKSVVDYGYEPVITVTAFRQKMIQRCLFTTEDRDIENIEDMEGMSLITYRSKDGYYPLRQMLDGKEPGDFFGRIIPSYSGQLSLREMLDGAADLAFVYDSNIGIVKMGNPSLAKRIKRLMCSPPEPSPGIVVRSLDVITPELLKKILGAMDNIDKAEALKPYRPLIMQTKIKFVPVNRDAYKHVFNIYKMAEKNGWDKDYTKWVEELPEAIGANE